MKTRVQKTVDKNGENFYPQRKGWFFWYNFYVIMQGYPCDYRFNTLEEAIAFINKVQNCAKGVPFFAPKPMVVWRSLD